ncbi:MAG: hybrid sensor histidine kinase/response regulator [Burkholderiaceae bacterium]|nr:hybrid sensor histidine kinase/response regulator [Burkholderiaceae bacterium]
MRLAKIAFVLAAMMAFAFWLVLAIAPAVNQASVSRQSVRLVLFVFLAAVALYLHFREGAAIRSFRVSVGLPMAGACLVVGSMGLLPLDSGGLALNRFPVAMALTCWLCYGFTRLPVTIVAGACVPASLLTLVGSSLQGDDHVVALGIYLGVANLTGWIMSVEIERRERALFWSSRKLAEATRSLEEMARNAADADAAKMRVLAAVSHDLRQPLASLALYAQLLRTRNEVLEPAGLAGTVERLDACVSALSGNLDRLSELGGLRDRDAPLPVGPTDLRSVLERLDNVYAAEAARRGVRLVVRRPRSGRQFALSNENRLWDILSNLTGNALKFSSGERAAWVLVRVRRSGGGLLIEVRDNGIGVAPADQRRMFDEYFQVANHARNPEHGHGLGLSIVREAVTRLPGHSLQFDSWLGIGTRFRLSMPASAAQGSRAAASRKASAPGTLPRRGPSDRVVKVDAVAHADGVAQADVFAHAPGRMPNSLDPVSALSARHCEMPVVRYVAAAPASRSEVEQGEGVAAQGAAAAPSVEALAGAYVLFIEDDDSMRDALGQMLQQWGVLVDAVASGEEALALAAEAERSFDAIISDFRLPGTWDGLRLIEELRRLEGRRTPAILLSGEFRVDTLCDKAPEDVHVMAKPPQLGRLRELLAAFAQNGVQA